jgi:hypothetical protein
MMGETMKFRVTFKDPDGPLDCLADEAKRLAAAVEGIDDDEREALAESRRENLREFVGGWLEYSEYVTIEFDTEANTATVVPCK